MVLLESTLKTSTLVSIDEDGKCFRVKHTQLIAQLLVRL